MVALSGMLRSSSPPHERGSLPGGWGRPLPGLGRGDGTFDSTTLAEAGRWAWGSIPVDLDGNGALDLFVPNGFVTGSDGERPDL